MVFSEGPTGHIICGLRVRSFYSRCSWCMGPAEALKSEFAADFEQDHDST